MSMSVSINKIVTLVRRGAAASLGVLLVVVLVPPGTAHAYDQDTVRAEVYGAKVTGQVYWLSNRYPRYQVYVYDTQRDGQCANLYVSRWGDAAGANYVGHACNVGAVLRYDGSYDVWSTQTITFKICRDQQCASGNSNAALSSHRPWD